MYVIDGNKSIFFNSESRMDAYTTYYSKIKGYMGVFSIEMYSHGNLSSGKFNCKICNSGTTAYYDW